MALPPIRITIEGDASGFEKSIAGVDERVSDLRKGLDRTADHISRFGVAANMLGRAMLPVSASVTAAAGTMFLLARTTASAGDEIAKSSRAAGVAADALQELRFALSQAAGVGDEQTSAMLVRLNRRLGDAVEGNRGAIEALGRLGISLEDVAAGAAGTEEVFTALVREIQNAPTDAAAAAVAFEWLGREGAALGGKLRESGADIEALRERARDLGLVMSGETLAASERFNDQLDELRRKSDALKMQIGAALLPAAIALADGMMETVVPALQSAAEGVAAAVHWFGTLPEPIREAAGVIGLALGTGGPILVAVGTLAKTFAWLAAAGGPILGAVALISKAILGLIAATGPVGLFIAAAAALYLAWQQWGDDIVALVRGALDSVREKFNEILDFLRGLPGQMMQIGRDMIAGLWQGLSAAWGEFSITGLVTGWADGIASRFRERLGIESPSRVFHEYGMNIGEGLAGGIQDSFSLVEAAVSGLGQAVSRGAFRMADEVVSALGQMFRGSKPIAAAQALINTYQGITEALKLPFPASLAAAARVAAQGFAAVRGIQSARPGGGGGGGGGVRGAPAGGGGGSQPAAPVTTFQFTLQNDPMGFGEQFARQMVERLNEASRNGGQVRGVIL